VKKIDAVKRVIFTILKWFVLIFFLVIAVLPIVWLVIASLKTNLEIETGAFTLPKIPQFNNYVEALAVSGLPRLFLNSCIVAFFAVGFNLFVTSLAAFVLAREKFFGRNVIHTILTAGVLIPIIAFMVPYFSLITTLKLYDTLLSLILVYAAVNIPVSIFLITSFMQSIPKELEEAAVIDGCGFFSRYFKIILPLSQSGLVTAGTFCFIYSWNEFVMSMLLTSSENSRTIQLGIRYFQNQFLTNWGPMFAAVILAMIPSIIVYMLMHDRIIEGLTAGSVKG